MKKIVFCIILLIISVEPVFTQEYFKPKIGGLENVIDGGDFYKIEVKNKTANEIYNAILAMVNEQFNGDEDEIIETKEGELIKAKGVIKKFVCNRGFDVKFNVEFKIKDGRYIFLFNKYNVIKSGGTYSIVFQKGSNLFAGKNGKTYMFNEKGEIGMKKSCYKDIVKSLDMVSNLFDISDDFEKYATKKAKNNTGW